MAITNKPEPNLKLVQTMFIKENFMLEDLRLATLVVALRNEKKDYHISFIKSVDLIKELMDKSLYPLLTDKSIAQIWTFLENKF